MSASSPVVFAIPGELDTPTGGYAYDRHLITDLPAEGHHVTHLRLGDSFPHPTSADVADAKAQLDAMSSSAPVMIDGLAFGALDTAVVAAISAPVIALIHHPLAFEGDLPPRRRKELFERERDNLAHASAVIVTSHATARLLVDEYSVETARVTIAEPGVDRPTTPHQPADPPLILSVGSQSHRKGHDVLLESLAGLLDLPWQALIVGAPLDRACAQRLQGICRERGLSERVRFMGALVRDDLDALYASATVFALATRFEGYGMVFSEAMAHGLPIVSCDTGAVGETVAPGAGILTPPDDPTAFAQALRSVLNDESLRASMASASHTAGSALPTWQNTASIVSGVIDSLGVLRDD